MSQIFVTEIVTKEDKITTAGWVWLGLPIHDHTCL